ncbi:hypothetical protein L1987_30794 [Smallanthus sonchifolius]|uniref:Uncharacterized protein n=1 Tax=Smallanthus sonchifolius TaxID=185202 RepID=A0ACB9I3S6_9ASTR|nr:hypothetical protein L1987_30794 [Smallanthus sonchifolius]
MGNPSGAKRTISWYGLLRILHIDGWVWVHPSSVCNTFLLFSSHFFTKFRTTSSAHLPITLPNSASCYANFHVFDRLQLQIRRLTEFPIGNNCY